MKARRGVYLILLVKFLSIYTTAAMTECDQCFDWQYCREEDATCVDCDRCGNGQGAVTTCSRFNNTVCEPCADGTYTTLSTESYAYVCYACTNCGPDRDTIANCTREVDTTCGPCPRGMFAYNNGTCLECSLCPDDDPSVPRYPECGLNGAPRNYMCVPGVCKDCDQPNITLNMSEGGWVTRATDQIFFDGETQPTTQDTTVVAAVAITLAVVVSIVVILVGLFSVWLLYGMYCKERRRGWQRRQSDGSAENLMDAEETTGEGTSSHTVMRLAVLQRGGPSLKHLEVAGVIREVQHVWSPFAEALGVITEVDCTCDDSNTFECCRRVLDELLKDNSSVNWNDIIEACDRCFLHSVAMKLKLFFTSDEMFSESDVVLWDYFVSQIKRESEKLCIIPKWCSQFDNPLLDLIVSVQGQTCTLEDAIVLLTKRECPQPIILVGETGCGKTTMALQLVRNWCKVGSSSQFALVIYVDVTQIDAGKVTDLPGLIRLHLETAADTETVGRMCDILVKQQGKGSLIILDGYDEMAEDSVTNIFQHYSSLLPKVSLLFIGQPGDVTNAYHVIEVPLLLSDQIEQYIKRTVGRRGIAMIRSSAIRPMMHNPLLLAIACHLIYHNIDVGRLSTITQLYHTFVIKLISDRVKMVSYSDKDHSATVRSLLSSCAKASYEAIIQSQCFIISHVDSIVESGLLVKHRNTLYFVHHTFQEFFAATHIALFTSDFDYNSLKVVSSDYLLLFISGLTGRIAYRTKETDNNSLTVASSCHLEARSPVNGQHSTIDTPLQLDMLKLNNGVMTPHQQLCLEKFIQEYKGVKKLDISGFTWQTLSPISTSVDLIYMIFNSKYLTCISAVKIDINKNEWIKIAEALMINTSLITLDLSFNTSIGDDDVLTMIATSLGANCHLKTLILSSCDLTSTHTDKLTESLLSNMSLLHIDLSSNLIEKLDIKIITKLLKLGIIQEINISNNPIDEEVKLMLTGIPHQGQKIKL